jgi:SAM-dependent methyltransferase
MEKIRPYYSGFIKVTDPKDITINRVPINQNWWSRPYEYGFISAYIARNHHDSVVADYGCGWNPRPLTPALCAWYRYVYAVDVDARVLERPDLQGKSNLKILAEDFTKGTSIPDNSIDWIFCVGVIEHVHENLDGLFEDFYRVLRTKGRIFLTFDSNYDPSKKCDEFITPAEMFRIARKHFKFFGKVDHSNNNVLFNKEMNLTVYRCVLEKKDEALQNIAMDARQRLAKWRTGGIGKRREALYGDIRIRSPFVADLWAKQGKRKPSDPPGGFSDEEARLAWELGRLRRKSENL